MGTQSAFHRRRYRQVMALINPPSLPARTRSPEDIRAARVLWMVEERLLTIIRRSRKPATGPCMFDHH
jgi:hypothetical protein